MSESNNPNPYKPFDMPAALSEALSDTLARAEKAESENASLQRLVNGIKEEAQMYKHCYIKSLEHLGLSGDDICPNAEEFICLLKKIKEENLRLKEMLERMAEAAKDYQGKYRSTVSLYLDDALDEYQKWTETK